MTSRPASAGTAASAGTTASAGTAPSAGGAATLRGGILRDGLLAGIEPEQLAEAFGTPFYAYDLDLMGRRVEALRAVLPPRFRLAYAVKANPALAVVAQLRTSGVGADVASAGELETVRRAGFTPEQVVFTGPGKRDEELEAAVEAGVGAVTVESPGELRRLEAAAARNDRRQPVLLRLAVDSDARFERVRLIGHAGGKFGMALPDLRAAALYAAGSPHLEPLGVHAFGASNVLDADRLADHVAELVAVAREVAAAARFPLRLVDAGGGLGIPYGDGDAPLDLDRLGDRLTALAGDWSRDAALAATEVLLEPGRFFVGPAGVYVARVVDVKGPADAPVATLEGGINHAVRPALVGQEHRLAVLAGDAASRERVATTVSGPLCTGLDVFAAAASLPRPRVGDLVALLDVGAYGFTESMPFFLSHPTPAEVAIRDGQARLMRARLTPSELLDRQLQPDW